MIQQGWDVKGSVFPDYNKLEISVSVLFSQTAMNITYQRIWFDWLKLTWEILHFSIGIDVGNKFTHDAKKYPVVWGFENLQVNFPICWYHVQNIWKLEKQRHQLVGNVISINLPSTKKIVTLQMIIWKTFSWKNVYLETISFGNTRSKFHE